MIYDTPTRDADGCYIVKVKTDDNKKCLVQVNNTFIRDLDGEVELQIKGKRHTNKINPIDEENLRAAAEKSVEWFKKEIQENALKSFYTPSVNEGTLVADKITASKIFSAQNEATTFDVLGEPKKCNALLEFAGIWFAKKTFGPIWNIVQVKIIPEPEPEPEAVVIQEEVYPDECILTDAISEDEEE